MIESRPFAFLGEAVITKFQDLIQKTSQVLLDKKSEIKLAVTCLVGGGHLLIEDVPGVGKTTMVLALAQLTGLKMKRVQFTVDLLPGDIIGGQIFNPAQQKFQFYPGPIFTELMLADELNRASPRTQSALLQAMEEGEVSVDGETHSLQKPFFVIATQNPHQQTGTFPLPESQLDRFFMSLELNYASKKTEAELFQVGDPRNRFSELKPLFNSGEITAAIEQVRKTHVAEKVAQYVANLLENSRRGKGESLALSTRGGFALVRGAQAWAFLDGRDYVRPEDVQAVGSAVVGHRLGGNYGIRQGREWAQQLLDETPVPI